MNLQVRAGFWDAVPRVGPLAAGVMAGSWTCHSSWGTAEEPWLYAWLMTTVTAASATMRASLSRHRLKLAEILDRYDAVNPRLFGSVARGEARSDSDIDLLVDLIPERGNELLRLSGLAEELTDLLGRRVDVVSESLLREEVSLTARQDAVGV